MEGDDREPPAFGQQPLGGEQALDQLVELGVHRDAQRLEAARRGMRVAGLAADGLLDQPRELGGRRDRLRSRGRRRSEWAMRRDLRSSP